MLSLTQILGQYPEMLRGHPESLLREYLQCKILRSIFDSAHGQKLVFLGGTALRLVYEGQRFSEDLDFDNLGVNESEWENLAAQIQKDLELEGFKVETSTVTRSAYRIKIRIPELLFKEGLSPLEDQKIMIQVDTVPQDFEYTPFVYLLNKLDVFGPVRVVPKELLLAQKIYASVNRKRAMGRDFFDIVFLMGLGVKPDFGYLQKTLGVSDGAELKAYLLERVVDFDFAMLAKDVEPFLFNPKDAAKVSLFREFWMQVEF